MQKRYKKFADTILLKLPVGLRYWLFSLKRFHLVKGRTHPDRFLMVQLVDGRETHGGLADRLKGMVSAYCIADRIGYDFRIKHTSPFKLEDYLAPNEYDWRLRDADKLSSNFFEARIFHVNRDMLIDNPHILEKIPTTKQIHSYCKGELFKDLKDKNGESYEWGIIFKKLFRPTPYLRARIDLCKEIIGGPYITVVYRFQNLLGDFLEYSYQEAQPLRKEQIIEMCRKKLEELRGMYPGKKILVTSDSSHFLKEIETMIGVFSFPSKVVHLDTVKDADFDTYGKSFVDFYLIAESERVFSVGTQEMYKTNFPNYAAQVNGIPFKRILIA